MAPLIESARAAREESARMRLASHELRLAVRANNRLARARKEKAVAAAEVARRNLGHAMISGSPWSGLDWRRDDEQLSHVLVPVD